MKKFYKIAAFGLIGLILLGGVFVLIHLFTAKPKVASTTKPTATKTPTPTPPLAPIEIDAIAARSYPGSAITNYGNMTEQGGYRSGIMSYQSDGFKIYALLAVPNSAAPASGWPVIILEHGYIDPAVYKTDGGDYQAIIAALAEAGYAVIKPDFRGNGKSEGTPEGGHFSPDYTYDVMNLITSVKQDSRFDAKRIGQFAHSMGGHTALRTMVVSSDIKATVMMAGVVGSFDDIFYRWPNSPVTSDRPQAVQTARQSLIDKYGTPASDPSFWNAASAINYVSRVTGATQVNQDTGDSVVPKLFADHLVDALKQAGKPVEYNLYPGNDHQFTQNRAALLRNVLAFYKATL